MWCFSLCAPGVWTSLPHIFPYAPPIADGVNSFLCHWLACVPHATVLVGQNGLSIHMCLVHVTYPVGCDSMKKSAWKSTKDYIGPVTNSWHPQHQSVRAKLLQRQRQWRRPKHERQATSDGNDGNSSESSLESETEGRHTPPWKKGRYEVVEVSGEDKDEEEVELDRSEEDDNMEPEQVSVWHGHICDKAYMGW